MPPTIPDCNRRTTPALALAAVLVAAAAGAQTPVPRPAAVAGADSFVVFVAGRQVGREEVAVSRQADGWVIRGSSTLNPPFGIQIRQAELTYDGEWRPRSLSLDGVVQGREISLATTFADGKAANHLTEASESSDKVDEVSADAVVLPNVFFGGYAALAARLGGTTPGSEIRAYIAPQAEIPIVVDSVGDERIETPGRTFDARRYTITFRNPSGALTASLWTERSGALVRLSVPAQTLEVAREDVASAAARISAFSIAGDESVRVPANGFSLAATVTAPKDLVRPAPAVVLIGGSGPTDRDGTVAGVPVIGQIAKALVEAGFVVVRYDKRGVGQSGGRPETATLTDYAEDARAVINYLRKSRKREVDPRRIAVLGHSEGAWTAMRLAASEKNVAALVLVAAASSTGGALVLEQQQHLLDVMKVPEEEKRAKAELQTRINAAATGQGPWDGIEPDLKAQADTPWFASFLAFDPAKVMKDVRQPILIVQGELDTQVPAHHADQLADMARARKRRADVEVARVAGVNHLLLPATTGEVTEYTSLAGTQVSRDATGAISGWLRETLSAPGK
ncbi:MAG: alpha/beta fold hydrolase [Vicinamibacterales bacterium]